VAKVVEGRCYYNVYINGIHVRKIVLRPGDYRTPNKIIHELHVAQRAQMPLQTQEPKIAQFSYDEPRKTPHSTDRHIFGVEFSPDLARLLGFDGVISYTGEQVTAERHLNLNEDIHSVYVYCDLLEHVPVGDTKAPLLRIVDKPRRDHGNVYQVLNPTLYVPLQKKNFNTVEINIMTDTGLTVPFLSGKSFDVLEFRHAVHRYFAI